jgi:[CysO sulfur-carrier protein]-S-L-cysteine hydrolase
MTPTLRLPRAIADELLRRARDAGDDEVCGVIAADARGRVRIYPIANVAADRTHRFELDPKAQIDALRDMRERGAALAAIYHSHPRGPARPSALDLERHAYPEALCLIIAPTEPDGSALSAFRIDGRPEKVAVGITPD